MDGFVNTVLTAVLILLAVFLLSGIIFIVRMYHEMLNDDDSGWYGLFKDKIERRYRKKEQKVDLPRPLHLFVNIDEVTNSIDAEYKHIMDHLKLYSKEERIGRKRT